jgi:histidinol-phosphate aminotransferase
MHPSDVVASKGAPSRAAVGQVSLAAPPSHLRLCSNENRIGLSSRVRRAIAEAFDSSNVYPDDSCLALTAALAAHHGVAESCVLHGHGSTEVLRMAANLHALRGRGPLLQAGLTFEALSAYAHPFATEVHSVPLDPATWSHDLSGMRREAARFAGQPVLAYVCNPNNPTGSLTPVDEVEEWIVSSSPNVLFVIDEAYCDFVEDPSFRSLVPLAVDHPNVLVLRTFSKAHALAGLRVGYGVGHPSLIEEMLPLRAGRGPNHLGNAAALASLEDPDFLAESLATMARSKAIVLGVLGDLGLGHIPSHANFVMHEVNGPVEAYIERMWDQGFIVGRAFPELPTHNRVTLGLPEEMKRWAETLRAFREQGWV